MPRKLRVGYAGAIGVGHLGGRGAAASRPAEPRRHRESYGKMQAFRPAPGGQPDFYKHRGRRPQLSA